MMTAETGTGKSGKKYHYYKCRTKACSLKPVPQDEIEELIAVSLTDVLELTEVPAANEIQCGWGESHSLEAAKAAARAFLDRRAEWSQVTA